MQVLVPMCAGWFALLIHHRWEHEAKRDCEEESESPLLIFQREDERTGSVEEARQAGRSDREEEKQAERCRGEGRWMRERREREGWRNRNPAPPLGWISTSVTARARACVCVCVKVLFVSNNVMCVSWSWRPACFVWERGKEWFELIYM